ncbi:MAG: helix-turn-helix domain-containing protein [Chitinophagaceae bacterium]
MIEIQLLNGLSKIIVFLLVFFSFFLLTVKTSKKKSNQLFAFFLLFIAFDISGFFLNTWLLKLPLIENLRITSTLLQMPILYLYVLSVCYSNFTIKAKYWVHGLLFVIYYFVITVSPFSQTNMLIFQIISELQYAFYIILLFFTLKEYRKVYVENYANPENLHYRWLVQMITVILIAHIFVLSKSIIRLTTNDTMLLLANVVVIILALLVSCFFVLKALYQPRLFRGIDQETKPISTYVTKEDREKPVETNTDIQEKINFLEGMMAAKEPFLDPDLTIRQLAEQMNLSQKELSALINHHMGKHFFDFINEFRIHKAMEILKNPAKKEVTVLEILYEVGFNSKSSFNTAFKKHSELTPVEFRRHSLSES